MASPQEASYDIAVIGAGMAGASAACELAGDAKVLLLEQESQPGFHTTGRSAALFAPSYGPDGVRALSRASSDFLNEPPVDFCDGPILSARGVLMVARNNQRQSLDRMMSSLTAEYPVQRLDADATRQLIPLLKKGDLYGAMLDERAKDIDVDRLHQGYLRRFKSRGGRLETTAPVTALDAYDGGWSIASGTQRWFARTIVNAAGAWADQVAALAGAKPVGLVPKRRTAIIVAAPEGLDISAWPAMVDVDEQFYLMPHGRQLLISPADETPSEPCDAQPDELDIAICIDRISKAFDLPIKRIASRWAGLRSFVADGEPVIGFAPDRPGFFWLAGQGGYGIQTAPAIARCVAALMLGQDLPADVRAQNLDFALVSAQRFRTDG